ncbi:glycosyltransferase [Desulfuromonas sp. KJ2020]|uniref:glycosyltransferase n=1 Tax=Desulfuromonas sp. KJ2020 TaxID=2919173 RepID=UPI0020A75688|nr:glycosyltransferase [Desulfuromonas sp. KJ2020]
MQTTFIQKLPLARQHYRHYLPLMPLAIEQLDLSAYDLVISSSHAVAKGVITGPDQVHVCLCYSPMRYAWDLQHQYLRESGLTTGIRSWAVRAMLHRLRQWDYRTAQNVDHFIAISQFVQRRIWKAYRRESTVLYPPVDTDYFTPGAQKEDFYFTASRLVPYKRIDLIVEAFKQLPDKKLVVIGDGPEMGKIREKAGHNVQLLGHQPKEVLKDHLQRARAFIFVAEEDFGIAPLEAQACGTPVIAFGKGGTLETLRCTEAEAERPTAVFFQQQEAASLLGALETFEQKCAAFQPANCRQNAQRFSVGSFVEQFRNLVIDIQRRDGPA